MTVLSMGPPQVIDALREAVSLGADKAVLLADPTLAGADTLATSYALAKGVERTGRFDLVICGRQAIDGDTAQVGPELAERLGVPHVSCVTRVHEVTDGCIIVERMMDDGSARMKLSLPGLITVTKGINEPRFPSLEGKIRAVRSEIPIWSAQGIGADLSKVGLKGSPTRVIRVFAPERRARGEMLEGTVLEQVAALVGRLREADIV